MKPPQNTILLFAADSTPLHEITVFHRHPITLGFGFFPTPAPSKHHFASIAAAVMKNGRNTKREELLLKLPFSKQSQKRKQRWRSWRRHTERRGSFQRWQCAQLLSRRLWTPSVCRSLSRIFRSPSRSGSRRYFASDCEHVDY